MWGMPDVAWLGLRRAPRRLAVAAVGVALAMTIMLLLVGIREGVRTRMAALIDQTPVQLWISDPAVDSITSVFSLIPAEPAARLRQHPDVAAVHELYAVPIMADVAGRKTPLMLYGYDQATGVGGPWRLTGGRFPAAAGEAAVDAQFARQNGLAVGGELVILGERFRIAGLSAGTQSFMSSLVFVDRAALGRLIAAPGMTSFLLVQLRPGADAARVQGELAALAPDLLVRTAPEMAAATWETVGGSLEGPFRLLIGIAFLAGLLTAALMLYTATLERMGEYQVLRAVGSPPGFLARLVLEEALMVGLAGTAMGVLVAALAGWALARSAPEYVVALTPGAVARSALLVGLMALGGALLPLRRVLRLDPAAALRG